MKIVASLSQKKKREKRKQKSKQVWDIGEDE